MTVVVLTSGTSWPIPGDWTAVNQEETWGAGAGGAGNGSYGGGAGGSGGYNTTSNLAGLSGSINIGIGVGGAFGNAANGGNGTATWFNGANLAASSCGSNGGSGGTPGTTAAGVGGAGASTTGSKGTATAGSAGGSGWTDLGDSYGGGGGGAGAPGPSGLGAVGATATGGTGGGANSVGGTGGTGDSGSGGAGGAGGPTSGTGSGVAGTANVNGGGGGGGGTANGTVTTGNGGPGGLPGAGGGGGSNIGSANGTGGGGQIRITYTPAATNAPHESYDLPVLPKPIAWNKHSFQGWQRNPLSAPSVLGYRWTELPAPKSRLYDYSGFHSSPIPAPVISFNASKVFDVPRGNRDNPRWDYSGFVSSPLAASALMLGFIIIGEETLPQPFYDLLKFVKRYDYSGWEMAPQPFGVVAEEPGIMTDLPVRARPHDYSGWRNNGLVGSPSVLGYRWTDLPGRGFTSGYYQDWKLAPQQAPTNNPGRTYDVPQSIWTTRNVEVDYNGWLNTTRPAEYLVPAPRTEVPGGKYNAALYQDWQEEPNASIIHPVYVQPWTDLPLTRNAKFDYSGWQLVQPPIPMQPPVPVYDIPRGVWKSTSYQHHTAGYQRLEFQAPAPVVEVPRNVAKFDFTGWADYQSPILGPVQSQGTRSYDLPPYGALSVALHSPVFYQGAQGSPTPPSITPTGAACWLPLVYVGNTPIGGGGASSGIMLGPLVVAP
jgi:hypothetical protein